MYRLCACGLGFGALLLLIVLSVVDPTDPIDYLYNGTHRIPVPLHTVTRIYETEGTTHYDPEVFARIERGRRMIVYGEDDRVIVPCSEMDFFQGIVQFHLRLPNGRIFPIASGYVFAPEIVVTTAHTMYFRGMRLERFPMYVTHGSCNGTLGTEWRIRSSYLPTRYIDGQANVMPGRLSKQQYDYGLVYVPGLPVPPMTTVAPGVSETTTEGHAGYIAGYLGGQSQLYVQRGTLQDLGWFSQRLMSSDIDTGPGQSGGPCVKRNGTAGQVVAGLVRGSDYFKETRWNDCIQYDSLLLGKLVAIAALLRSDPF